jgi:hypothetical protein
VPALGLVDAGLTRGRKAIIIHIATLEDTMSRFAFIYEDPEYDTSADIDEQDMSPEAHLPTEEFEDFEY